MGSLLAQRVCCYTELKLGKPFRAVALPFSSYLMQLKVIVKKGENSRNFMQVNHFQPIMADSETTILEVSKKRYNQ